MRRLGVPPWGSAPALPLTVSLTTPTSTHPPCHPRRLTNWGLFLTIIHHFCFSLAALLPRRFLFCQARLRTATLHLWPTIFCLQLVIGIGFWVSASSSQVTASGAIPAHIVWPFLVIHLALCRATVVGAAFVAPFFTGLLYLAVNGIYTGAVAPVYSQMTWTNGVTAAIIFIGLAILVVAFLFLWWASAARDRIAARRLAARAPPAAA